MKSLHLKIPDSLWAAIQQRHRASGEPIPHIVRSALAEALGIAHSTLFQVSTSGALVEGVYQGAVTIARLQEHGDFGLGTFEGLDGELVAFDGHFYQVRSDGTVRLAAPDDLSPFAVVIRFRAEQTIELARCPSLASLTAELDQLRGSANLFYALRIDGRFDLVHSRAMCKSDEGTPLAVAAAHQPEFHRTAIAGTLVGFWSPQYVKTLEVPGYHLHFLSEDRTAGGHLLSCTGGPLRVQVQHVSELQVALPENPDFLKADLTRDPAADLDRAEKAQ